MCGVVGVNIQNVGENDLKTIRRVFLETEIRGKHASGISWFDGKSLKCIKKPIPISELLEEISFNDMIFDSNVRLIGHIRYSTSDIEYNQPITGDDSIHIVHNGVITQQDSSLWKSEFGYDCKTKNDSELLWNCFKSKENYLEKFKGCSASYISLDSFGNMVNGRNSLRPQWIGNLENGFIISSTKNILLRSGIEDIEKVSPEDKEEKIRRDLSSTYNLFDFY